MLPSRSLFLFVVFVSLNVVSYGNEEKENPNNKSAAKMTTVELIRSNGYEVEEHEVRTKDGYILTMQRIPKSHSGVKGTKTVFLMHGTGCMASSYVDRGRESLAFMMADKGFDVWLANQRGSPNSLKHKDFDASDSKFWNFNMDQISEYDIPAMWDTVLQISGTSSLQHVGFATGLLAGLQAFGTYPEYDKKVTHFVGLSPMSASAYAPLPIQIPAHLGSLIKNVPTDLLTTRVQLWSNSFVEDFVQGGCEPLSCPVFFGMMFGYDIKNYNKSSFKDQVLHCPAGSSLLYFIQFAQQMDSKRIQKYDHGIIGNMVNYGSLSPPGYDFSTIETPVSLFVADNDPLANPMDIVYWEEHLPKNTVYRVDDPLFTHSDFLWGKNAPKILYPQVLKSLM